MTRRLTRVAAVKSPMLHRLRITATALGKPFGVDLGGDSRQQATRDTEVDFIDDPERAGDQVA